MTIVRKLSSSLAYYFVAFRLSWCPNGNAHSVLCSVPEQLLAWVCVQIPSLVRQFTGTSFLWPMEFL